MSCSSSLDGFFFKKDRHKCSYRYELIDDEDSDDQNEVIDREEWSNLVIYKCDERKEDLKGSTASSSKNTSIEVNSSVAGNRNKAAVKLLNTHSNKAALWINVFAFIGCRLWYGPLKAIANGVEGRIIPGPPASVKSELFRLNARITRRLAPALAHQRLGSALAQSSKTWGTLRCSRPKLNIQNWATPKSLATGKLK
ncbi:hypothetical protein Q3G72_019880 [Acer saccharum]|nr:hypothetical protein Q3G72_019880 [Acer saccharum]